MTLLIVDNEKCKKDGICAMDCPMAIIQVDKDAYTETVVSVADDARKAGIMRVSISTDKGD